MLSRIQTMRFRLTTNAAGYVQEARKLSSDMILGNPIAFSDGNYETIEFFDLYVYARTPDVDDIVAGGGGSGGGDGGGGGGGGGAFPKSPPALSGAVMERGKELVVAIKDAVASTVYHVLIPYQIIEA